MRKTPPHITCWTAKSPVVRGLAHRPLLIDLPPSGGGPAKPHLNDPPPTHPPTHIRKLFLGGKNEVYQRERKLEAGFGHTNLFLASDPSTHAPLGAGLFFAAKHWPASALLISDLLVPRDPPPPV